MTQRRFRFEVEVHLGHQSDWSGSIHDDASARRYGYRAALVPGPSMHGYLTRPCVEAWGEPWLRHGVMTSRCRRGAYDGQRLVVEGETHADDPSRMTVVAKDVDGEVLASGEGTLPAGEPQAPAIAPFDHHPYRTDLPRVAAGEIPVGLRFMSHDLPYTAADHEAYLALLSDDWPGYRERGWIHPSWAVRLATHNATRSFVGPTPGIYVTAWAQHLSIAKVGDRLRSSGWVTRAYVRKGSHYYDTEELVLANGDTPVAHVRRSVVYAIRPAEAA